MTEVKPTEDRTAVKFRSTDRGMAGHYISDDTGRLIAIAQSAARAAQIVTACNAYEPMREALSKIANCGQSQEPDHWQFRVMARDTSNAALSTLPVNDRHHSGSDNARLREAENAFGADTDDDVTDWGQENIEENARAARSTSGDVERLRDALAGLEMLYERPGEDSIEQFERIGDVFYKQTGYLRPGKDCRLHDPDVRSAVWRKWIDAKIDAARAALKGVPQPASDDNQADAGAPALSEKVNGTSEWLPIETAPKNGARVLIFRKSHVAIGQFDDDKYLKRPVPFWSGTDAAIWGKAWAKSNAPTHWMPLPSPPGAELNFSNDAERDAVSLKPDTSSQPASEAGKLSTDANGEA